jgi:hypothetical protein
MARLNIAMLSEQAQEEVVEVQQQTELEVVGEQAEDAIAEATQIQTEIEGAQQAADDAEEVVQEVEEERQVLEQAQQQGGAEKPAMEALQRAFSRFEKRTGVPSGIRSMGMESFSSKASRPRATEVAMEGAVEYIKKIIKMLTDAMAAVWEKVKAFFEKIWIGADRLAKRADQLKAAAKAAQGKSAAADATIKAGSVLAFARKDDAKVEGKAFADQYIKETAENFAGKKSIEESLDAFLNKKETSDLLLTENKEEIVKLAIAAQGPVGTGKAADGLQTDKTPRMLGDYVAETVSISSDSTWEQLSANYNKIKTSIVFDTGAKDDVVKEVKPMDVKDAERVAVHASGHMASYKGMREEQKKFEVRIKKIIDDAKKMGKDKEASADQLRVAAGVVRAIANKSMSMLVSARSYDVNLTKAALDYVAASVKAATGKSGEATGTQVATTDDKGAASASTKKTQVV